MRAQLAGCVGDDDSADDSDDDGGDPPDDADAGSGGDDTDVSDEDDGNDEQDDDEEQASVEIPDNAYEGPSGDEPAPVQIVGRYYAAVNANDPDETARYEHSAYPWGGATQEDLEEVVWFDDLELALIDEDLDEEEIEDISMFSFASSRSRDAILEAAEGEDTALVSVEGTGK